VPSDRHDAYTAMKRISSAPAAKAMNPTRIAAADTNAVCTDESSART
jgi:hypothetical protein